DMTRITNRIETGPKDNEKDPVVLVRRDTGEKEFVPMSELENRLTGLLEEVQQNLYDKALAHRVSATTTATTMDEFKQNLDETPGFIKAMWCGDEACEEKIQDETQATSRLIPFDEDKISDKCICCGRDAEELVYWAKAY